MKKKIKLSLLSSLLVFSTASLTVPMVSCALFLPEGDNNGDGTVNFNVSLTASSNLVSIADTMKSQFVLYLGGPTFAIQEWNYNTISINQTISQSILNEIKSNPSIQNVRFENINDKTKTFAAFEVIETLKYIQLPPSEAGSIIEVKLVPVFKKGFNVVLNSEGPRDFTIAFPFQFAI